MMELQSIDPRTTPDGTLFRCTFHVDAASPGATAVDLTAAELQHYHAFQRAVLDRTGLLYQLLLSESRPELADFFWRQHAQLFLEASARQRASQAGQN